MPNFKVTNVSSRSGKGSRNVFLTEAGKLLKPGDSVICNRLTDGTQRMVDAGTLKVEKGDFAKPPVLSREEEDRLARNVPRKPVHRVVEVETEPKHVASEREKSLIVKPTPPLPRAPLPVDGGGSASPAPFVEDAPPLPRAPLPVDGGGSASPVSFDEDVGSSAPASDPFSGTSSSKGDKGSKNKGDKGPR